MKLHNKNRPISRDPRQSMSLKTKWRIIKLDVAKFCVVYKSMFALKESYTSSKDVLECSLELNKVKYPRQYSFVFVHYWLLVKEVPH